MARDHLAEEQARLNVVWRLPGTVVGALGKRSQSDPDGVPGCLDFQEVCEPD